MARRWLQLLTVVIGVVVSVRPCAAQAVGATTGAIAGTVTDRTGAVLPGVAVVLSSDRLLAGRNETTTDISGRYRLVGLPAGEYWAEFERSGYRLLRRHPITITSGDALTLDVTLDVAVASETVIVQASPVVNPGTTAVADRFDARELANLPLARSMPGLLSAAAGLDATRFDVAGNSGPSGGIYGAYGSFGGNQPRIEGINVSGIAPSGTPLNFGALDEAIVLTAAHGPEWPSAGVHMQLISRSGGNRYSGSVYADYQHRRLQAFNIAPSQLSSIGAAVTSRDANRQWSYHDLNADVGGYLRRNRAWWYGSVRRQEIAARYVNFPPAPVATRLANATAKLTYQWSHNHRLVAFVQTGRHHQPYMIDGVVAGSSLTFIHEATESTARLVTNGWVWKGEWNGWIANRWFAEARVGAFGANRVERPNGRGPRLEDAVTAAVRGGNRDWEAGLRRTQLAASLSRFAGGPVGTHQIKVGGELIRATDTEYWHASYAGDVLHIVRDGVPAEVVLFSTPSLARNGLHWLALHAGDSWRVHRRLTMNLGLRFDRYRVFLPAQQHPASGDAVQVFAPVSNLIDWNVVAPRLGASLDLTGGGRILLKGTYGQYWLQPGGIGPNSNPNATEWWRRFPWNDANATGVWEPGEEDATHLLASRGGAPLESLERHLKLSYTREATVWYEHELAANFGMRTGIVWRTEGQPFMRQNISWPIDAFSRPITIADPGPDGRPGSADDGPSIQGFELEPSLTTVTPLHEVRNVPVDGSAHLTWEVSVRRRFTDRWSLSAAYGHTWNRDHAREYFGQPVRSNLYPVTPNDFIHTDDQGRYRFTTWTIKAHATYEGPWGLRVSPLLRIQSGQPFGRTFTHLLNYGLVRILAEPIGTRRMPHVALLDIRTVKLIPLTERSRIGVFVDVFNTLNVNPEQSANWSSGSAFGQPQVIVAPRVARIGVRLDW